MEPRIPQEYTPLYSPCTHCSQFHVHPWWLPFAVQPECVLSLLVCKIRIPRISLQSENWNPDDQLHIHQRQLGVEQREYPNESLFTKQFHWPSPSACDPAIVKDLRRTPAIVSLQSFSGLPQTAGTSEKKTHARSFLHGYDHSVTHALVHYLHQSEVRESTTAMTSQRLLRCLDGLRCRNSGKPDRRLQEFSGMVVYRRRPYP
jgi:hypothetical protein